MKKIRSLFTDSVSGDTVFLYRDCYGVEWMSDAIIFMPWSYRILRNAK